MNKVALPRACSILDAPHNPADPNPWQTLWLDQSIPINAGAKLAWLRDSNTWSRQFILPFVRPLARLSIVFLQIIKTVIPNFLSSSTLLHRLLAWALSVFATPEANWLILRHFWIGSENLAFLNANIKGAGVVMSPLTPHHLPDLKDHLFIKHDLNLFNFITRLNLQQRALSLSDSDFWRSVHSLQLDETIGIYAAKVLNKPDGLILVNNKHPMVVPATWSAGYRLVLHGLSAEMLHALLVEAKGKHQQSNENH